MELNFAGHQFVALPQRGLFWPAQQALLVADLHWGKDSTFRAHGIPVSRGLLSDELERLIQLCRSTNAQHLWVLGDLCHSRDGLDDQVCGLIHEACQDLPPRALIEGNHDRHLQRQVEAWGFDWWPEPTQIDGVALNHHPLPGIHGHLHPTFWVKRGRERVRLPCFHYNQERLVLPAFTGFSNGVVMPQGANDKAIVIAGTQLFRAC